jgi:dTDP-4-amino-4,6-dideoxygalactose transaminase
MDFIDLKTQQKRIKDQLDVNISRVLAHGSYVMGPEIRELESKLAAYVGVRHAVGCASGTDALLMALMALDIGPGDAVFTTPFTFIATAEVISLLGATPVFVDIDPMTYNIDPEKLSSAVQSIRDRAHENSPNACLPETGAVLPASRKAALPPAGRSAAQPLRPRAVIPVDLFGLLADYDAIDKIAKENGMFVIEDAAQSFGAEYNGKKACSFGHIACTSFFPAKPLGCYGDGGMCFTNDDALAAVLDSIRVHGKGTDKYDNIRIGINGRLDTLQAAILLAKFEIFPEEAALRGQAAARYTELLTRKNAHGERPVTSAAGRGADDPEHRSPHAALLIPSIPAGHKSVWAQYSLLAEDEAHRSAVMNNLKAAGIPTAIYYPKPLHLQTAFASLGYKPGAFPVSEDAANRIFSLPMHPYLSPADSEQIVNAIWNDRD